MSNGEKQGGREHIERNTECIARATGLPKDFIYKKAREARIRNEQREDGRRK